VTPETEVSTFPKPEEVLDAERFVETYRIVAEWIRFADAKAAATLTINGVLLGLLIPTLRPFLTDTTKTHPVAGWTTLAVALFIGWLVFLALSAVCSFLCILPFRGPGRELALAQTTHFHPAAVAQKYSLADHERFISDCGKIAVNDWQREILAAILIDAHLSNSKYTHVSRSIRHLAISVVFAFLYLLTIQF
jgi:hypothetical protein